ncbi:hypothetical protein [Streptomyces aureus]|uniref:hypothetical protein n=1 Tax=Streptomyces aureus TaxID=193461 RepID=UPI000A3EE8DC|nr:hypothetical protein [Streptomyces aureus]
MTAAEPQPCDTPDGEHDGRVRLYPCGWRCSTHSPWALAGMPEPGTAAAKPADPSAT